MVKLRTVLLAADLLGFIFILGLIISRSISILLGIIGIIVYVFINAVIIAIFKFNVFKKITGDIEKPFEGFSDIEGEAIIKRKLYQRGYTVRKLIAMRPVWKGIKTEKTLPTKLYSMDFINDWDGKRYVAIIGLEKRIGIELDDFNRPKDLEEFDDSIGKFSDFAIVKYENDEKTDKILEDMAQSRPTIKHIIRTLPSGEKIEETLPTYEDIKEKIVEEEKKL